MPNGGTSSSEASSVAVIGMSGRFPGAPNVATYWENIREGRETIRVFTEQELLAAGERPELLRDPAYVKACGYLDDIDNSMRRFLASLLATRRSSIRSTACFSNAHRRRSKMRAM